MKFTPLPAGEYLRECLDYDPATGELVWRPRPADHFHAGMTRSAAHTCNLWNSAHAGKAAFTATSPTGYAAGGLDGVIYRAHRIIWRMVYGDEPQDIDHINGNRRDNRIANLRAVDRRENMRNARLRSNNTSGIVGVTFSRDRKKWVAQINDGKVRSLGRFDKFEDAVEARKAAERRAGFHPNHGRPS